MWTVGLSLRILWGLLAASDQSLTPRNSLSVTSVPHRATLTSSSFTESDTGLVGNMVIIDST